MKNLMKVFGFFAILALVVTSCSKSTDKILVKKDGKWDVVTEYTEYKNGVVTETSSEKGSITFSGSNFTMVDTDGDSISGTWSATDEKVTLSISGATILFNIVESKNKKQTWENIDKYTEDGDEWEDKTVLKLTR